MICILPVYQESAATDMRKSGLEDRTEECRQKLARGVYQARLIISSPVVIARN
jgi:hypothetical protein